MVTLISLIAIPAVAVGSVLLISKIGGKNAAKKVQELRGNRKDN